MMNLSSYSKKEVENCIEDIKRNIKIAHDINPNDPILLLIISEVLIIKNESQAAENLLKRAQEIINSLKVHLEIKEGTGETIQHEINTTTHLEIDNLEINKMYSEINFSLGKYHHKNNKYDVSETYYQNCVDAYHKHYAGLFNLAKVQCRLHKYQKAEETMQKLITILAHNDDVIKSILKEAAVNICSFTPTEETVKLYEPLMLMAKIKQYLGKNIESLHLFEICTYINNYSLDAYLELAFGYQRIDLEVSIKYFQQ